MYTLILWDWVCRRELALENQPLSAETYSSRRVALKEPHGLRLAFEQRHWSGCLARSSQLNQTCTTERFTCNLKFGHAKLFLVRLPLSLQSLDRVLSPQPCLQVPPAGFFQFVSGSKLADLSKE